LGVEDVCWMDLNGFMVRNLVAVSYWEIGERMTGEGEI
jgi:hypothetical protein